MEGLQLGLPLKQMFLEMASLNRATKKVGFMQNIKQQTAMKSKPNS